MNPSALIGHTLKSDEIVELLEAHDIPVIYDFDRTHENIPDQYWASSRPLGIQLRFDEHQVLDTIFLHLATEDEFSPFNISAAGVEVFPSIAMVEEFGSREGIVTKKGRGDFLGSMREWAKLEKGTHSIHYEFRDGVLALITIQRIENGVQ